MSKRGPKSKAGTLDFWNTKEGKRQIARQLKAEDVSASVQRKAADARLLEDGWVRSPPLSGQYVQKSDVATGAYNALSAESCTFRTACDIRTACDKRSRPEGP